MTNIERLGVTVGDRVVVEHDGGGQVEHEVRTSPWRLQSGHWVVGLSGISGGYSLDRIRHVAYGDPTAEARLRCDLAFCRESLAYLRQKR